MQTIHAFCTQLLHQFPFEANVAARFTVLDETAQAELLEELTLAALLEGAAEPESALGRALGIAMTAGADQTFRDVVREAIGRRDAFIRWRGNAGSVDAAIDGLSRALGLEPQDSLDSIEAEFVTDALIASSEWPAIAAALAEGSKRDCEQARRFEALTSLSGSSRLELYLEIFFNNDGSTAHIASSPARSTTRLWSRFSATSRRAFAAFSIGATP